MFLLSRDISQSTLADNMKFKDRSEKINILLKQKQLLSQTYNRTPVIASNSNGQAWVVSLEYLCNGKEHIVVNSYKDSWSKSVPVTPLTGLYETPQIACAKNGKPMIVWVRNEADKWIIESILYKNGKFGNVSQATYPSSRAANPVLIASSKDTFWLAWESYESGKFKIYIRSFKNDEWSKTIQITDGSRNAYDPAIALDSIGKLWITYSMVENAHRNIYLTSYDTKKDKLGKVVDIAIGGTMTKYPNINAHPAVACDDAGCVWICWESNSKAHEEKRSCYFGHRFCPVVCYKDGKIQEIVDNTKDKYVFRDNNDHLPTFVKDSSGRLWIFTRNSDNIRKWHFRASRLESGRGWTEPIELTDDLPHGRAERAAVAIADDKKFWIVWQGDNFYLKDKWFEFLPEDYQAELHVATLKLIDSVKTDKTFKLKETQIVGNHDPSFGRKHIKRRQIKVGNEKYTLLFGSLHEHTNFSRCCNDGSDGDLHENYRYGIDVEGYDFIGLTDHGFDLHEQRWRKSIQAVKFYNSSDHFIAIPAYEWTLSAACLGVNGVPLGSGHRNIIFASEKDAAKFVKDNKIVYHLFTPESDRIDKVWNLLKQKDIRAITIPHHPADRDHPVCWELNSPEYETVVEIYQCRGSAEYRGCPGEYVDKQYITDNDDSFVSSALEKGCKLGFIASGDHNAMGVGLAALFVKEISQEGIYEALKSRRCYGTMGDKIFMDFRVNNHLMGEEITCTGNPRITAVIDTPYELKELVLFRNKEIIHQYNTKELNLTHYELDIVDKRFADNCYYYLRVIQQNNQIGWASPVWVNRELG